MRVKWSRNLDVPAQQRGGQTSARESSKDDRRKSFLNIFKFRDRKNEDDRRKASESEIYPPREVIDGKIRKTVTFADQQSSGTSVVCNRKGRRVSADAVDMTVFKVSKSDSLSKPQSSCTAVERSPLFKRTEDDGTLLPERKQSERSETGGKSKSEKPTSSDAAPVSRESEVRSLSSRNKTDLSRTLGKSGTCTDEEQKNGSKIPILVSKESFSVAKDAFKSDFWSNNIEISAKSQRQFSSSKLGLESDRINSYGVRKNTLQPANKREEEKTVEEMLRSKVPVSDSVSCKDSKIKAVSEKSHHQICLGEAVIPRNLSRENNKQAPIKTPSYSPVGYCGISKLVLPKVVVNDKVASTYGVSNNYRKDFSLQGIGTPRFESKKESSCHNKPPLLKNDPPADQENVKPKEELSTQEKMSENKSDCPTQEGRPASNEVVESDDIVSAPPVERKSGEVTSPPKLPADKTGDALIEATTGENTCPEKPLLNVDPSENEASTCSATELNAADKSAADLHAAQVEKNQAAADGGVVIENNDNEIPLKQNNSLSPLCLQPNDSLRCLNEIVLTKEVKDQIILASNAPIPVKSGIENMRNLLDASVIIVNHRELSTKPWICNIFTPREPKRSCFENRLICDKGSPSSRTETGRTNEISSASCKDEVREIVLIQNNISVEPKKAIEMPSCGHSLPTGSDHTQDVITEQEVVSGFSKEVEQQDTICRLIEDDNVAFIDEHIDTPEEIASDNDKEAKSDISLAPALNTAIASINKIEPDVISETAFECRVSKSGKCWQQSVPEICSAGHMADDNEKFEGSSSDDPVCIPQGSDVEAGNLLASCSDADKRDVLAYRDTRDERKIEKSPSEKDRADSEILHFRPSLPFESATEGSASVKLEDGEIPHTSNASEVNCDAIPLKKYDSIEFIDDITDEESNSGRSSDVVSPSMSSSADGQEDASTKEKEVQLHTSQSGDVFKTEPKTSQSPGVGKYGGSTQTQGPPAWSTRVELQQEIQRLGTLCEARTKELNHMKMNFRHASLGFDAFVVLFQYLTDELDAFSQPRLVLELEKTHTALEEAEAHLHQYQKEFEEMKAKHSEELCKLEKELNQSHQETIENLNLNHNAEIEELRQCHDKQLAELAETHMKQCQEMEEKHSTALLELKNEHSLQIEELKIFHADQIEAIENSHHETRMELNNQLKELEQQCKDLKHQAKLVEEALQRDTDTKIQWISAKKADLEKEVDSLKTVLDMRRTEIHSLRKENLEMKKELEKLPIAKEKIKMLEAKAEDLQALVNEKIQIERQLSTDHQNLKESYEKESKVNTRLSMENEELMWKLKQNYEANLLLSSFTGGTDTAEKSPLKSPARQSVSLPMFFHSMETTAPESDKMSLPMSSSNVTPCKKLPPLARKCSSPVRTPSFVGASPPGPCSRKCKLDLKAVISPRKQKHKLHHSEKKFPSKETDSTSGHHPSETELLQHSRLQYDESCHCAKDSSPSSVNGTSSDGSQPDCLGEMDHNGVLFDDPLNRSNGSSNEEMYSAEAEYLDESLNFEHYDMLITNQILSKKYKELTHLKKGTEITHEFDDSQHDSFFSYSNSDNHSIANSQNVTAAEEIASSKDFTFNEQHFADIQPQEYHLSFPCHSGQSFHKKSDSWTVSSFCGHTGEPAASTLSHSGCDNSLQSHLQPENSSVTTETHSQITQPSTSQNCSHPLQSTYSQEK